MAGNHWSITTVDFPGATNGTDLTGINGRGEIVGTEFPAPGLASKGFTLDHGTFTSFTAPEGRVTFAQGINNHGDVAGFGSGPASFAAAFVDQTAISAPGAFRTEVYGVNNDRDVVGLAGISNSDGTFSSQGFLEHNGRFSVLNVPGSSLTPQDISNTGEIVGYYARNGVTHGFAETDHYFTTVDVPGAISTSVLGENDLGQLVGSYTDTQGHTHGFLDSHGHFTTLDKPGAASTLAADINGAGTVVGSYTDSSGLSHGFMANHWG
jgi:hypothetical protein